MRLPWQVWLLCLMLPPMWSLCAQLPLVVGAAAHVVAGVFVVVVGAVGGAVVSVVVAAGDSVSVCLSLMWLWLLVLVLALTEARREEMLKGPSHEPPLPVHVLSELMLFLPLFTLLPPPRTPLLAQADTAWWMVTSPPLRRRTTCTKSRVCTSTRPKSRNRERAVPLVPFSTTFKTRGSSKRGCSSCIRWRTWPLLLFGLHSKI